MKILFLHLSDFHFKSSAAVSQTHLEKIIDATRSCGQIDEMVIVLSGDIAYSGANHEYNAARLFLNKLFKSIKGKNVFNGYVHVVCVPGNHDIAYTLPPRTSATLNEIFKDYSYSDYVDQELTMQKNFFAFVDNYDCFREDKIFDRIILDFNNYKIEFNLINSAIFSLMKEEDKGLHFIDQTYINELNQPTGADFVISVIHHPPEWYIDEVKHQLETAMLCKSSLIFSGHEHWSALKESSYDNHASSFIHCGGSLCDDIDWSKSEFETGLLNTETLEYKFSIFRWNNEELQYEQKCNKTQTLESKPSIERKLVVRDEYIKELFSNSNHFFSNNSIEYFVFPRVEKEAYDDSSRQEFIDINSFIEEILPQKKVLITGVSNSGKTSLLKALFMNLTEQEYCVIYTDIDTIKKKDTSKIVKANFEDIYGEGLSLYSRFSQLPIEKKILIIDDIDKINKHDFERYINEQSQSFGLLLFTASSVVDLDIMKRVEDALNIEGAVSKYRISPFYSDKRRELVGKLVKLRNIIDPSIEVELTIDKICDSMKLQNRYISLNPDFLITFVEYYLKNEGTMVDNDSSIFSKAFESKITTSLAENKYKDITVEKLFKLLSMIAHHIHFEKRYPISEQEIIDIVNYYNKEYDDEVKSLALLETIKNADIFKEDSGGYKFKNRNHLAYFCAREVNFLYNTTGDESDLKHLINCCCFGINADILMFISYITDNTRILKLFLSMTRELTEGWEEFDFENNCPEFLRVSTAQPLALPEDTFIREQAEKEIEVERENNKLQTIDIYDYNEDDVGLIANQIIRSISLFAIISKCLPGFEHNMTASMREDFVREIFSLPNKIYYRWAKAVDPVYDELIRELTKMESLDYKNQSKEQIDKIEEKFKTVSSLLLLDIYNIGVNLATKENSFRLLDKKPYDEKLTYSIEKLMMIEKQKYSSRFVDDSISLYERTKHHLPKMLIQSIVIHAYIHMKSLDYKELSKLDVAFFQVGPEGRKRALPGQKTMFYERSKHSKRE